MTENQSLTGVNAILFDLTTPIIGDVVIADDDVNPALSVEPVQQIESPPVRVGNVAESVIGPQLVPISGLDVGESPAVVVGQCL